MKGEFNLIHNRKVKRNNEGINKGKKLKIMN